MINEYVSYWTLDEHTVLKLTNPNCSKWMFPENNGWKTTQIMHFNRVFRNKPSILGAKNHYFWETPPNLGVTLDQPRCKGCHTQRLKDGSIPRSKPPGDVPGNPGNVMGVPLPFPQLVSEWIPEFLVAISMIWRLLIWIINMGICKDIVYKALAYYLQTISCSNIINPHGLNHDQWPCNIHNFFTHCVG